MATGGEESRRRPDPLIAAVERHGKRRSRVKADTVLKQYELIRAEVTTSLQLQQQILGFGIATIGLLAGAAFVAKVPSHRSDVLVMFVPLVAYLALTIWFSEVMRMLRAGAFMLTLEKRLDDCGDGSLTWEYIIARGRRRHRRKPYFDLRDPDQLRLLAVALLFLMLAAASIVLGWSDAPTGKRIFAVVIGVAAVAVLVVLFRLRRSQMEELLLGGSGEGRAAVANSAWRIKPGRPASASGTVGAPPQTEPRFPGRPRSARRARASA